MRLLAVGLLGLAMLAAADTGTVLFDAGHARQPLHNLDECTPGASADRADMDRPAAADPYTLPEYVLDSASLPAGPFTLEVEFMDEGAGMILARVVTSEKPLVASGPSRQGSYTLLNTGKVRSAWF